LTGTGIVTSFERMILREGVDSGRPRRMRTKSARTSDLTDRL
jgi:hypothetical protein